MGKHDSSRTRVVPVFDALMDRDPTGGSWLPGLIKLGSRSSGRIGGLALGPLISEHHRWWGKEERRLNPPKALLRWLVENVSKPASESCWGSGETRTKRERLVSNDPDATAEAIRLLASQPRRSAWYVLEGQSRPDACLETGSLILVIEGKRTEQEPTTTTTWMPRRSQMLRHMDAASEIRGNKKVLGMMIVEGSEGSKNRDPSGYWFDQADEQVKDEMLTKSLPHRTLAERALIADGFLGVTTWQRVCSEFHLPWPPIADTD